MLRPEVSSFLSSFQATNHVILFYDTQVAKREVLFNHLKFGEEHQGLAYVCSEESPEQIRQEMIDFGLKAKSSVLANQKLTIANYDQVYIVDGEVNIPKIMNKFSTMVESCKALGMFGLRAGAEMSCFLRQGKIDDLIEYENALHRKLAFDAEGICAYNVSEMSALGFLNIIMPLVRAHDPVIFSSPKGFFIMKPEKVEKRHIEMAIMN
jgi:hypothetical protein